MTDEHGARCQMPTQIIYDKIREDLEALIKASGFECKRCGKCCEGLGETALDSFDISRWINQNRFDILARVFCLLMPVVGFEFDWCHPETKEGVDGCPFLGKVTGEDIKRCRIQETKPVNCVAYVCDEKLKEIDFFEQIRALNISRRKDDG